MTQEDEHLKKLYIATGIVSCPHFNIQEKKNEEVRCDFVSKVIVFTAFDIMKGEVINVRNGQA